MVNNYERKSADIWVAAAVLWLSLGSAEWVEWPGLLASEFLGWLRCIPLQLVLVAVAVEMSVSRKVSIAVIAGADGSFSLPCSGCHLEVSQPRF